MPRTNYHVTVSSLPASEVTTAPFQDFYPVTLRDGSQLNLPIQPLPGNEQAIALLMSNQTPFAVETKLASLLSGLASEFQPEVIAGIPTLGLDYARLVARDLGFADYVALGNSRKFWYDDKLSVPVHSITSPGMTKKLYLDPMLVGRMTGKRVLLVDDVINTGGSAAAAIELLEKAGANIVGLVVVLVEGAAWKTLLTPFASDWPERVRGLGDIPIFQTTPAGWVPIP